jgi:enoyl-CoA hydratase
MKYVKKMNYKSFKVTVKNKVATVSFNRPEKSNSLHLEAWSEMKAIFEAMHNNPEVRAIILTGEGKNFCAGIDLSLLMNIQQFNSGCPARSREKLRNFILNLQDCITSIERCRKPVLAAIHKACIGGAVDIIAACDMRYCTDDAYFTIREVDLGLVADIGTMQRLPTILNPGMMAEMAYTGRNVYGEEAAKIGLVNRTFPTRAELLTEVTKIAETIAEKSPIVIRGTKEILLHKRDHSVADSLEYIATWNAGMLFSNDIQEAFKAYMMKKKPEFED